MFSGLSEFDDEPLFFSVVPCIDFDAVFERGELGFEFSRLSLDFFGDVLPALLLPLLPWALGDLCKL